LTNSKIISFFCNMWQIVISWYNNSFSSKLLKRVYGAVSNSWSNSVFVRKFYTTNEEGLKKSFIYKLFYLPFAFLSLFASKFFVNIFAKLKATLAYKIVYCFVNNLLAASTRFIGVFLFCALSVYTIAVRSFLNPLYICALVFTLLLCIWDFSLLRALSHSIIHKLLKLFLSIEPTYDYYDETQLYKKGRLYIAAAFGIVLGFICAYISPVIALGIAGALVVMFNVELGVAITVFAIPFLPTMLCAGLAILCFFALFIRKCARGDKQWKLDYVGFALILFIVIVGICSFTSVARENSLTIYFLYIALMSFYFTIVNTVKTKEQLYTLLRIFTISALFVAAYGIIQYIFGLDMDKQVWIDEEMFTDIKMRAFSTLENPNVLGEYLLLTIPVAVAFMWSEKKFLTKLMYAAISAVLLLCLVLTMSRGCWIGVLVVAAVFITFVDARYWALGILALFLLPSVLPASILNRFLSIGDLGDSSSSYRLYIWLGTLSMLKDYWFVGIGPGSQAYNLVYPRYAYPTVIAPHSHNVYLQQMVETGVVGIGALIFVLIAFFRNMSKKIHIFGKKSADAVMCVAICAGVAGFLVQGVFDYVFYNYRVFMMFWMFLAFGASFIETSEHKKEANND